MKRLVLLLVTACALSFAQDSAAPEQDFSTSVQTVKGGVVIQFQTNDPAVTAFYAEVEYVLVGSVTPARTQAVCMVRYGGTGGLWLRVGDVSTTSVHAWEIKTWGRSAATQSK